MLAGWSTATPSRARVASAASRSSLAPPQISLVTSTSPTPPSTMISASLTFWQQTPTAPRAICRQAMTGLLCVLACGRSRMPGGNAPAIEFEVPLEGV